MGQFIRIDVVCVGMFPKQGIGCMWSFIRSSLGVVFGVERDCVKYRFCTVRSRAFDPDYDKDEERRPWRRPKLILETAGEGHHVDGRRFERCKQQEEKSKVGYTRDSVKATRHGTSG